MLRDLKSPSDGLIRRRMRYNYTLEETIWAVNEAQLGSIKSTDTLFIHRPRLLEKLLRKIRVLKIVTSLKSATTPAGAMDVDGPRKYLSAVATPIMNEGIALTLTRWSALQMAVDNIWGGRNSGRRADQLIDEILSWFINSKELYVDDLEALLEECMLSLNAIIDDGSIEEVAESLMTLHEKVLEGNYSIVENLRERPRAPPAAHIRQTLGDEDDSEDDDEDTQGDTGTGSMRMSVDATNSIPNTRPPTVSATSKTVEAEDGWTTVSSSRRKISGR